MSTFALNPEDTSLELGSYVQIPEIDAPGGELEIQVNALYRALGQILFQQNPDKIPSMRVSTTTVIRRDALSTIKLPEFCTQANLRQLSVEQRRELATTIRLHILWQEKERLSNNIGACSIAIMGGLVLTAVFTLCLMGLTPLSPAPVIESTIAFSALAFGTPMALVCYYSRENRILEEAHPEILELPEACIENAWAQAFPEEHIIGIREELD